MEVADKLQQGQERNDPEASSGTVKIESVVAERRVVKTADNYRTENETLKMHDTSEEDTSPPGQQEKINKIVDNMDKSEKLRPFENLERKPLKGLGKSANASSSYISELTKALKNQSNFQLNENIDGRLKSVLTEKISESTSNAIRDANSLEKKFDDGKAPDAEAIITDDASAAGDDSLLPTTGPSTKIPENILSPPKSEAQTDETNTATSSSPASDSQCSPSAEPTVTPNTPVLLDTGTISPKLFEGGEEASQNDLSTTASAVSTVKPPSGACVVQPINVVVNGTIPKSSGKPLMAAMNKKLNKSARTNRARKPKIAMYESEISDNKIGIKLCIKKSDISGGTVTAVAPPPSKVIATALAASKQSRKRSRKSKMRPRLDSDDSEYETKRKKDRASNNNGERQKKVSFSAGTTGGGSGVANESEKETVEQSEWGSNLPEDVLYQIFQMVVKREGCLPTLLRLGRVCSLWRRVSLSPTLWKTMDLSTWMKEKYRTELKLKWFVDNRCSSCTELNVSNWKVSDINCFLGKLAKGCPNLAGITLSGWKSFTSDHLTVLVDNMKKLQRLDLSSINVEMNASKSAVGLQSLCNALQTMNERLTHLHLAHNRLAGIPQIVNILSSHCPNLVLLDLSNVTTQATSHGILHIEKLQHGCQKLKVLRVTNSHVTLSTATMQEMMDSPGFPDLEELSVAAPTDESRVIGDEHLQRILKTSSKLKLLDVRSCTRLTHESLIRLPAWDIKHLFLSGCSVTRDMGSGLELIASKWAHSLIELDLAWANVQQPLDNALRALAEKGSDSPLAHLNLCGSSVSDEAVKDILANCAHMSSINLSSCRGLPRGIKRLMQGQQELQELRDVLKVQMKVKLPAQLKQEKEEAAAAKATANMETEVVVVGAVNLIDIKN